MARYGKVLACVASAVCWAGWSLPLAAEQRPAAAPGTGAGTSTDRTVAATSVVRAITADDLERAERAVEAAPATTIWHTRRADGTVELSDRAPARSATGVERLSYPQARDGESARRRADAERDYWRRQSDGFERRRLERERDAERARRDSLRAQPVAEWEGGPYRWAYPTYGWLPPTGAAVLPGALWGGVSPTYGTTPGAAQGRSAGGFIGSGFATSR